MSILTRKVSIYNRRLNMFYSLGILLPVLFMTATSYIFSLFSSYSFLAVFSSQLFGFIILTLLFTGFRLDKLAHTFARDIQFSASLETPFKIDSDTEVFMRTRAITTEAFAVYLWCRAKPHAIFVDRGTYDALRTTYSTTEQARACLYSVIAHELSHTRHHDCLKHLFLNYASAALGFVTIAGIIMVTLPANIFFLIVGLLIVILVTLYTANSVAHQQTEYRADAEAILTTRDLTNYKHALYLITLEAIKKEQGRHPKVPPKDIRSIMMKRKGLTNMHPPFARRMANLTDEKARWI